MLLRLLMLSFSLLFTTNMYAQSDVKIGNQIWMNKNLDVTRFRDGSNILIATTSSEWKQASENGIPAACYYNFDSTNQKKYGLLYNWFAVKVANTDLAPEGYHIPSQIEISALINYLGGTKGTAGKLKGGTDWKIFGRSDEMICYACNTWSQEYRKLHFCSKCNNHGYTIRRSLDSESSSDQYGFKAEPTGWIDKEGTFSGLGQDAKWWSNTFVMNDNGEWTESAWSFYLSNLDSDITNYDDRPGVGLSVRCLKNQPTKGELFLAESRKKSEIKTTNSGLQYKIINEGTGNKPTLNSTVKIKYTGNLINGNTFDNSEDGGAEVKMSEISIKGWLEGIQLMSKGAKYIFNIPGNLGFGENGVFDIIGPNEVLVYEIELLDFKD